MPHLFSKDPVVNYELPMPSAFQHLWAVPFPETGDKKHTNKMISSSHLLFVSGNVLGRKFQIHS